MNASRLSIDLRYPENGGNYAILIICFLFHFQIDYRT